LFGFREWVLVSADGGRLLPEVMFGIIAPTTELQPAFADINPDQ